MPITPGAVSFSLEDLRDVLPKNEDGEPPSRRAVKRWLDRHKVPVDTIGNRAVVWLSDLGAAFPQLQRSLELGARRDEEDDE